VLPPLATFTTGCYAEFAFYLKKKYEMKKGYKNILVIDLEATCWEDKNKTRQDGEIIEIGIAEVDVKELKITNSDSIIVKPTHSEISEYCTNLTTLTPEFVEKNGISFKDACNILTNKYKSKQKPWFSYGAYDRHQFAKQCALEHIPNPVADAHLNVKNIFGVMLGVKEMGMARALDYLNIPLSGTHHRGIDDAINIAKILIHIFSIARHHIMDVKGLEKAKKGIMLKNEFEKLCNNRHSIREFSDKEVTDEDLDSIYRMTRKTPSVGGLQV
jgi:inhibitor of KinA sporulation pathway (predicted exonuclease)